MDIGTAFPSAYLKAGDIPVDRPVTVRIDHVTTEEVGKERDRRPVLYFTGKEKGMVLNKTNANTVAKAYGNETDDWQGKPVQIVSTETEFGGEMVACLRLRIPRATPPNGGGGMQPAATLAERGAQVRNKPAAEQPFGEESAFEKDDLPF